MNLRALQTFVAVADAGSITRAASSLGTEPTRRVDGPARARGRAGRRAGRPRRATLASDARRASRSTTRPCAWSPTPRRSPPRCGARRRRRSRGCASAWSCPARPGWSGGCRAWRRRDRDPHRPHARPHGRAPRARTRHPRTASRAADAVEDLDRQELLREPFVAVFPKGGARSLDLRAIARELPLIRYTARSAIGTAIERYLRRMGIESPHRPSFDSSETVLTTVAAGNGWTITTPLCIAQGRMSLDGLRVAELPFAGPAPTVRPPPARRIRVVGRAAAARWSPTTCATCSRRPSVPRIAGCWPRSCSAATPVRAFLAERNGRGQVTNLTPAASNRAPCASRPATNNSAIPGRGRAGGCASSSPAPAPS